MKKPKKQPAQKEQAKTQKTIYLISQAGFGNLGDELILREWLKYIDNTYQGRAVIYVDVVNVNFCRMMNKLWNISSKVEFINLCWNEAIKTNDEAENKELYYQSLVYQFKNLPKIDILHILGGGYINDIFGKNIHLIPIASLIKKITGCKLFATGISFHPLESINSTAHRYFLRCLNEFEFIDVRDGYSVKIFENLSDKVIKICDDLFLPNNLDSLVVKKQEKNCNLSLLLHIGMVENMVYSYVSELIDFCMAKNIVEGVKFYCFDSYSEELARNMMNTKPNVAYKLQSCFDLLVNPIEFNSNDLYFCTKFHGHFLVSLAGMHGVCSATSAYYDNKHNSLIEMGSGFKMVGMHDNMIDENLFNFSADSTFNEAHSYLHKLKADIALQIYQP